MPNRILSLGLALMLSGYATPAISADDSFCDATFILEAVYKAQVPSYHRDAPGEMVKISDQTPYIEVIPAIFEHVIETVVVQEARSELVIIPAIWEWVEGEFPGTSDHSVLTLPEFETVRETVVVKAEMPHHYVKQPAEYTLHQGKKYLVKGPVFVNVIIPAVTKDIDRRVATKPARLQDVTRHNIIRNGRTYKIVQPSRIVERALSASPNSIMRRVVKIPARSVKRVLDEPLYEWVPKKLPPELDRFVLRDNSGEIIDSFETRADFEAIKSELTCAEMTEYFAG